MAKFVTLTSTTMPLRASDVDTDQIIPARFLKVTDKEGLADCLFADWRQDPSFVLNDARYEGAQVLVAGHNFGCGSSREHAPWALYAHGFRAVISPSFADIFKNNALKNGLLPVAIPQADVDALFEAVEADPEVDVTIDLPTQSVSLPGGKAVTFPVDEFAKHCLIEGIDQLGYLQGFEDRIAEYEARNG